ncbi:hypothetical protein O6H91_18G062000 [Diphasiastrum complanatum]|uniref:Uncharacterized protein n=1 Tax=Diphasiastrum complanatum TaxID=34168 RepID=A0ACC2B1W4_DIPCM|nr:hypothetical protein O6H91_18G062000 [Diphasiastrum complanatum]
MAGRGRMALNAGGRGHQVGAGVLHPSLSPYGSQLGQGMVGPQGGLGPSPALIEQKLATQHAEIQRLLTENQRLAATHVALREELAAAQPEIRRLEEVLAGVQAEKEAQIRGLVEKQNSMEADLRAADSLKAELHQARNDAAQLNGIRQELGTQIQTLSQELQRAHADLQQVPALRGENESLRQEIQRARTAFEFEKKANNEQFEERQVMEKNLVSMAREVEKLRAELTVAEKRARAGGNAVGGYGGVYDGSDAGYSAISQYGDGYGIHQVPVGVENRVQYVGGQASAYGAYDVNRTAAAHGAYDVNRTAAAHAAYDVNRTAAAHAVYDVNRTAAAHVRR